MNATADEPPAEKRPLEWRTILAPTDFSDFSRLALSTAVSLAESCGAGISLLHVVHPPTVSSVEETLTMDALMNSCRDCMEQIAEGIPATLIRDKLVRLETNGIVQDIVGAAREVSADLIVIATHGHTRLQRILLGSTAEKVVLYAPCPVLVVRQKEVGPKRPQSEKNRGADRSLTGRKEASL